MCEELATAVRKVFLCVWVTLLFCEFGGAVAHGRSVTTDVLSVAECGFCLVGCVCVRERGGER